ncbi:MAG: hypothetical protein ACTHK4_07375 [Mycobacteriales bacterium]
MSDESGRRYRALVLCAMRNCSACAREVMVRNDRCHDCGAYVPKPSAPRIPQPRRELQMIPATAFGMVHAAAAMTLDVAIKPSIN